MINASQRVISLPAKEKEKERQEKKLGKKSQKGEFVPYQQVETPVPKEEDFTNDMINDLIAQS